MLLEPSCKQLEPSYNIWDGSKNVPPTPCKHLEHSKCLQD
jgi:hypothetical protein